MRCAQLKAAAGNVREQKPSLQIGSRLGYYLPISYVQKRHAGIFQRLAVHTADYYSANRAIPVRSILNRPISVRGARRLCVQSGDANKCAQQKQSRYFRRTLHWLALSSPLWI